MFSNLVDVVQRSPNYSTRGEHAVERITVHHTAGIASVEGLLYMFSRPERNASATYVIGNDGRIGGCVDEEWRPWTSNSKDNDQRAITIEVSNDVNGEPWSVGTPAWNSLIRLCVDVCVRYGIRLWWDPDSRTGSLTAHRWYAATACPGDWMYDRFPIIISEVNRTVDGLYQMVAQLQQQIEDLTKRVDALEIVQKAQTEQLKPIVKAILPVYKSVKNMPAEYQPIVEKLVEDGSLKGTGKSLDVSELMARIFVILNREGVL